MAHMEDFKRIKMLVPKPINKKTLACAKCNDPRPLGQPITRTLNIIGENVNRINVILFLILLNKPINAGIINPKPTEPGIEKIPNAHNLLESNCPPSECKS